MICDICQGTGAVHSTRNLPGANISTGKYRQIRYYRNIDACPQCAWNAEIEYLHYEDLKRQHGLLP